VYAAVPNVPPVPILRVEPLIPANVSVLEMVNVFPAPMVKIPVPVVIVFPLTVPKEALPVTVKVPPVSMFRPIVVTALTFVVIKKERENNKRKVKNFLL
jgi:hypothetical protein